MGSGFDAMGGFGGIGSGMAEVQGWNYTDNPFYDTMDWGTRFVDPRSPGGTAFNWSGFEDSWYNPYRGQPYDGIRNPTNDFSGKKGPGSRLSEHFKNHKADFNFKTEAEYLHGARSFLEKPPTPTTQSFVSGKGNYFRYDTATNEFGIMNSYGGVSTYFTPPEGIDYWYRQISAYAPK